MQRCRFVFWIFLFMLFNVVLTAYSNEEVPSIEELEKGLVSASSYLITSNIDEDKYKPINLRDENEKTSWVEGVDGDGIGEYVDILLNSRYNVEKLLYGISILPGYGDSRYYNANNRPKKILLQIVLYEDMQRHDSSNDPDEIIFQKEIILKDKFVFQNNFFGSNLLKILNDSKDKPNLEKYYVYVRLIILDVYKGSKYRDTAISEIRLIDANGNKIR